MLKKCTKCYKDKDAEKDFAFYNKTTGVRRAMCKECVSELTNRHYTDNKELYRVNQRTRRERNRQFIKEYLSDKCCVDCGNSDWRVLEFDHVRGTKTNNVSKMVVDRVPIETIKEEIAKCDVRCANCHRIVSSERAGHYRTIK